MLEKKNFLENNTELLLSLKSKLNNFSDLKKFFSSKEFVPFIKYDHNDVYEHLNNIKKVIDKITAIVFKPHITAISNKVIKRSELSKSLSNESFMETIKDSKLWKNKNGSIIPEYVYTEEYEDTLVTYENRFITMLIDNFNEELSKIGNTLLPLANSLEKQYESRGLSYGENSIINNFVGEKSSNFKNFVIDSSAEDSLDLFLVKLKKRLEQLMTTNFYKFNHKYPFHSEVESTNILLHDPLYFYCFKFYLTKFDKLYQANKDNDELYYNFALLQILYYLKDDIKSTVKISFKAKKLTFEEFSVKKGCFELKFNESEIDNAIEITSYFDKRSKENSARYLLIFSNYYSKNNYKNIQKIINENFMKFDDISLACQENDSSQFSNILNLTIYNKNNNLLIQNYLNSLMILLRTNPRIHERLCPVCGEKHIIKKDDDYVCTSCMSHYQIFNQDNESIIRMKSFRRKQLWKEK